MPIEYKDEDDVEIRCKCLPYDESRSGVADSTFVQHGCARPLVDDKNLYDFDSNFSDMMEKCVQMARAYCSKSMNIPTFNAQLAALLHTYILPSVRFRSEILQFFQF